jgi:hypothetical protein
MRGVPARNARILALIAEGHAANQIAEMIGDGCTRCVVLGVAGRAGEKVGRGRTKMLDGKMNRTTRIGARQPEPRQPSGKCRWIDGDPREAGAWHYCDKPVARLGGSWCSGHEKRVYVGVATAAANAERMARVRAAKGRRAT